MGKKSAPNEYLKIKELLSFSDDSMMHKELAAEVRGPKSEDKRRKGVSSRR